VIDDHYEARFNRLPQWAKKEIEQLRRERDSATERVKDLNEGGVPKSRVVEQDYVHGDRGIDEHNRIVFTLAPHRTVAVALRTDWNNDNPVLSVHGDHGLIVYPVASNSLEIRTETFR
jgi:hypothetical protein